MVCTIHIRHIHAYDRHSTWMTHSRRWPSSVSLAGQGEVWDSVEGSKDYKQGARLQRLLPDLWALGLERSPY